MVNMYRQSGISLIEIIVALVVLSVGLLSMAGLQMRALAGNNQANMRTNAAIIADNIIEAMRSNRAGVDDNFYLTADSSTIACGTVPTSCLANTCTAQQTAVFDLFTVQCGDNVTTGGTTGLFNPITDFLPNGDFSITCNDRLTTDADPCTGGSSFTVTINWQIAVKDQTGAANIALSNPSYAATFRP